MKHGRPTCRQTPPAALMVSAAASSSVNCARTSSVRRPGGPGLLLAGLLLAGDALTGLAVVGLVVVFAVVVRDRAGEGGEQRRTPVGLLALKNKTTLPPHHVITIHDHYPHPHNLITTTAHSAPTWPQSMSLFCTVVPWSRLARLRRTPHHVCPALANNIKIANVRE